ncbi:MAG: hypothetical protein GXY44_04335 [Phycisphaerales bacterium]|nr:hypothetical protein [Phycisphaerales bacterium]
MDFTPNIDQLGRLVRGTGGLLCLVLASGLVIWLWPLNWWQWLIVVVLFLSGGLGLFEAMKSWCVLRAYDYKTPV